MCKARLVQGASCTSVMHQCDATSQSVACNPAIKCARSPSTSPHALTLRHCMCGDERSRAAGHYPWGRR